ncbi:MAG: hypothetical protein HZC36_13250 [Armatimonadetes bacterium]|nr:hypothetical protein [Armatimonadota bacterium]
MSFLWIIGGLALGIGFAKVFLWSDSQYSIPPAGPKPKVGAPLQPPGAGSSEDQTPPHETAPDSVALNAHDPASPTHMGPDLPGISWRPDPLQGSISGPGVPPVSPVVVKDPAAQEAAKEVTFTEITVIVPEADIDSIGHQVADLAKSAGAGVQSQATSETGWLGDAREMLLAIPPDRAKQVESELLKLGSAQATDRWTGPYSERQFRVERMLRDAKLDYEARVRKLLIKYLDDAPEVLRAQEQLAEIGKALSAIKRIPSDKSAIRVLIGKKAISFGAENARASGT